MRQVQVYSLRGEYLHLTQMNGASFLRSLVTAMGEAPKLGKAGDMLLPTQSDFCCYTCNRKPARR